MSDHKYARAAKSQTSGNGLFANKAFGAGELILSIRRPLVGVVDVARVNDTCANCFTWTNSSVGSLVDDDSETNVKACSGCKYLRFCGKECQKEAWKRHHKYECQVMASTVSKGNIPTAARATMQLLTRRKNGLIDGETWESLLRLESHIDEMRAAGGQKWSEVELMAQGAWALSMTQMMFTVEMATEMLGRVLTNSLTLVTPTFDAVGICIDPLAATANHSCDPNAVVVMDGALISFRSLRPITKNEEIFISYVDNTNPFARRQQELKQRWKFTCKCTICEQGPQSPSDVFSISPKSLDSQWKRTADHLLKTTSFANDPGNYVGDDLNSRRVAVIQGVAFDALEKAQSTQDHGQAITLIENGMRTCYQSKLFPVHRQPYAEMRNSLLVNMIAAGRHGIAFGQGAKLYFYVDPILYPQTHHPVRVVHNWRLAILLMYLASQPDDPLIVDVVEQGVDLGVIIYGLLIEVQSNVVLSHGKESSLAKAVRKKVREMQVDMTRGDAGALRGIEGRIKEEWKMFRQMGSWMQY